MRSHRAHTIPLVALLALLASGTRVGAQNDNTIFVDDFATGARSHSLTTTVPLRRGVTTRVQFTKNFIDLVSFNSVSIAGGGTLSGLANGRTRNGEGMGFLAMNIAVPAAQTAGSTITVRVGSGDVFTFTAVHRGQIAAITRNPEPTATPAGAPWVATITGTDLGDVIVRPINCHAIDYSNRGANAVTATLTRSATCTTTAYGVALDGNAGDDPPSYNLASGPMAGFQFTYAPAGVGCVSSPNIGNTVVREPLNGQVIAFLPATSSPTSVRIRWDSVTTSGGAAPNNEWLVTRRVPRGIGFETIRSVSSTIKGLSTMMSFDIPGTHTVTIAPKNCGVASPGTTITFTTRYQ